MPNATVSTNNMMWFVKLLKAFVGAGALALALFILTGCGETTQKLPQGVNVAAATTGAVTNDLLRVGNKIRIEFSGLPGIDQIFPHEEQIKDDGTITGLAYLTNAIPAAGKTTRELEQDIHALYVPKLFTRITITVNATDRYYSVGGEVNRPGSIQYNGDVTVIKAIHAAGDFTIFAKRTNVQLIRPGKKPIVVNCEKAILDPEKDLTVYPGDIVLVKRKLL